MALSIKNDEADRLARELSKETGESLTDAVLNALRERLERERRSQGRSLEERIQVLIDQLAALPTLDDRPADVILGYDEHGVPS